MVRFIIRRLLLLLLTMFTASILIFVVSELAPGNIARNILGIYVTPEQEESFKAQLGLDRSLPIRYISWLIGTDWQVSKLVGMPLTQARVEGGFYEWFAVGTDGDLVQWRLEGSDLVAVRRSPDGSVTEEAVDENAWKKSASGGRFFWGVDNSNRAVMWEVDYSAQNQSTMIWTITPNGWVSRPGGAGRYIPLQRGFLRGDPGMSIRTGRPVAESLLRRLRNSLLLAGVAFVIIMPVALALGLMAGLNEGRFVDRCLSIFGLVTTVTPEFATGVFFIIIFAIWLRILPAVTMYPSDDAVFTNPQMLVLPVLTLALIELGYVLRMTRASMIAVMREPYIRTAVLKGLNRRRVVLHHALRNALMVPITVIMMHVNWLIGGIVVVEAIFGFPGLGKYLLDAAMYKDVFAIEAGAMVMVMLAVGTQLAADIAYTFLNPRIRYG